MNFKPFARETWGMLKEMWHGQLPESDEPHVKALVSGIDNPAVVEDGMSFLATLGKDVKAVFAWLGSSKGQAVVTGTEGAITAGVTAINAGAGAALAGGFTLINNWMTEALKVESLAAAAGQQTGSGTTKAAAVLSTMVPELTTYLSNQGYTSANVAAKAQTINNLVVQLLNTLEAPDGVQQAQNTASAQVNAAAISTT